MKRTEAVRGVNREGSTARTEASASDRPTERLAEIERQLEALRSLNVGESVIASLRSLIDEYAGAVACEAADQVWEQVEALGGTRQ